MSRDERDQELSSQLRDSEKLAKSYTYLRTAMVLLPVGLAAAVFYQSSLQGFLLPSVSAYYYTPAQAILVSALIALGACMIALKGDREEEVFLNLGGMFAAVVAIVPTSRGEDYRTAVRACRQLLTEQEFADLKCSDFLGLADATRANVQNNMFALLIVGLLGLVAGVLYALREGKTGAGFWWGFGAAFAVWLFGTVAFLAYDWFIDYAHYIAAFGLLGCIIVVAIANARRRESEQRIGASARGEPTLKGARDTMIRPPTQLNRYAWLAWVMVGGTAFGILLVVVNVLSLFWLEIGVAFLFALFWMVQTIDLLPPRTQPPAPEGERDDSVGPQSPVEVG
jgi:hypothetical protein